MAHYLLSLGSNRGDRQGYLLQALNQLDAAGVRVVQWAGLYETSPLGVSEQPAFLNTAADVVVPDSRQPLWLLQVAKAIEQRVGRRPSFRWGPREIDIDVVWWGSADPWRQANWRSSQPALVVPHERLVERLFVLVPLAEIVPGLPIHDRPVEEWIQRLQKLREQRVYRCAGPSWRSGIQIR